MSSPAPSTFPSPASPSSSSSLIAEQLSCTSLTTRSQPSYRPQCFCFFTGIAYAQTLIYDKRKSTKLAVAVTLLSFVVAAGVEAACIFGARVSCL